MSNYENVMECSQKPVTRSLKPITSLKPIKTGWNNTPPHSPKKNEKNLENFSEDKVNDKEQCSEESTNATTLEGLMLKIRELEETMIKKKKRQEFEAKKSKLLKRVQELENEIKKLDELNTPNSSFDTRSCTIASESEEKKNAIKDVHEMKANKLNWKTVVKKSPSPTEKKDPLSMEISSSVHELILASKKRGFLIPKEFLSDFFKTVEMKLELNSNVFAKFFPIYLNYRVLNQLFYLTRDDTVKREKVLKYIKYFGPPKWVEFYTREGLSKGLHTLMDDYEVECSFYMTDLVKEKLGYTKMSHEDLDKFEKYYALGWISFLDLTTDKVIPCDKVKSLFGQLL